MRRFPVWLAFLGTCLALHSALLHAAELQILPSASTPRLRVVGDPDDEWRFERSTDLNAWASDASLGTLFSGDSQDAATVEAPAVASGTFYRAVRTAGLFDPELVRTLRLTFAESDWQTLLANRKASGSNLLANLEFEGTLHPGVGVRYKGNTSYQMGGTKKSLNIEVNWTNETSELRGFKTLNLNNAAGDETILRETLYFSVMSQYTPCPQASFARLYINDEYWGLYSLVEQENSDLVKRWFPSNDGDRWKAPNVGGGTGGGPGTPPTGGGGPGVPPGGGPGGGAGGAFASGTSALLYLGPTAASYQSAYELKSDNSTQAWDRLVHAIDVLNNTPDAEFAEAIHEVLAVDTWLWFLATEIAFADDDSYFNKGADYGFYFEPESGRIHPLEHDGNEAFVAGDVQLSPVIGTGNTNRPVINRLLAVPEFRQRYLAHLRTLLEEQYNPVTLGARVDRYSNLTRQAIEADPKKNFTMAQYQADLTALKTFIQQRYTFLTNHTELRPLPPTIVETHDPSPQPTPADVPFVTAEVLPRGNDGIDSVWLHYRTTAYGRFTRVPMLDDGLHGDGRAGDHLYGAATAPFPAGTRVRYYVEARSGNPTHTAVVDPPHAEQDTHSYRVAAGAPAASRIRLNELQASNTRTLADPQGEFDDWIELHNTSTETVDLTGLYLSDEPSNPRKWAFPAGTQIAPGGFLLVWADEDGNATAGLHASFKLSASGEQILLVDSDANGNALLDLVAFPSQSEDQSYGRTATDPAVLGSLTPTPGTANR